MDQDSTQSSCGFECETMLNPELISWQNAVFRCYVGWTVVLVLKMFAMSMLTGLWRFIRLVSFVLLSCCQCDCAIFTTHTHTHGMLLLCALCKFSRESNFQWAVRAQKSIARTRDRERASRHIMRDYAALTSVELPQRTRTEVST